MNAGYTEQELADRLAADTPEERVRRLYAAAWDHSLPDRLAEAWSVADCADVLVLVTGLTRRWKGRKGTPATPMPPATGWTWPCPPASSGCWPNCWTAANRRWWST